MSFPLNSYSLPGFFFAFFLPFQITIWKPVQKMRVKTVTDFVGSPCTGKERNTAQEEFCLSLQHRELSRALFTSVTRCWLRGTQPANPQCSAPVASRLYRSVVLHWCHLIREDGTKTNTEFLSCVIHNKCSQCSCRSIWKGTGKSYSTQTDLMWPPMSLHHIFQYFHALMITNLQWIWIAWAFEGGLVNSAQWRRDEHFLCVMWPGSRVVPLLHHTCPETPRQSQHRASSESSYPGHD